MLDEITKVSGRSGIDQKRELMVMARTMWVLVLLVMLGGLVASGVAHGWTVTSVGITGCVAALLALSVIPTKKPAETVGAGRRGR